MSKKWKTGDVAWIFINEKPQKVTITGRDGWEQHDESWRIKFYHNGATRMSWRLAKDLMTREEIVVARLQGDTRAVRGGL